jgi:hypothetical protein
MTNHIALWRGLVVSSPRAIEEATGREIESRQGIGYEL